MCPCGLSFTRQDLLRRHERINHANEDITQLGAPPATVLDTVQSSLEVSSLNQDIVLDMHASNWQEQASDLEPSECLAQASTESLNNTHVPSGSGAIPSTGQQFSMLDAHSIPDFPASLVNNHPVHPLADFESSDMGWPSLECFLKMS